MFAVERIKEIKIDKEKYINKGVETIVLKKEILTLKIEIKTGGGGSALGGLDRCLGGGGGVRGGEKLYPGARREGYTKEKRYVRGGVESWA